MQPRCSQRREPSPRGRPPRLPACWHHLATVVSAGSFALVGDPTVALETGGEREMATIVVGTDSSAAADLAVDEAGGVAPAKGAEVVGVLGRADGGLPRGVGPAKAGG